jgi:GNAT superfamily N-acetyltransferase
MNYMIVADSKVDLFQKFGINSLLEVMFLAVLPEYGRQQIGMNLVKYSINLARDLKAGKNVENYLKYSEPLPQIISSLFTGRHSQAIGKKLGFEIIYSESFKNFSFNERNFAESVGDLDLQYHVAAINL